MSNPETISFQEAPAPLTQTEVKLQKILVPIDFSAGSSATVAHAVRVAKLAGASIALLHVVEIPRAEFNPGVFAAVERIQTNVNTLRENAQAKLTDFVEEIQAAGVECSAELRAGIAYEEILNAADATAPDLIVIGYKGASALTRFLLGSTAERVVRHARCSVLTVRG